jgi:hypothetical protein
MTFWIKSLFRSAKRAFCELFSHPAQDQVLLIETMSLLWAVRIGLWILPFRAINSFADKHLMCTKRKNLSVERIIWAVEASSRYVANSTCLTKSIAAKRILSLHGYSADIHLGVLREGNHLKAHAWLVMNGRILMGGPVFNYKEIQIESL